MSANRKQINCRGWWVSILQRPLLPQLIGPIPWAGNGYSYLAKTTCIYVCYLDLLKSLYSATSCNIMQLPIRIHFPIDFDLESILWDEKWVKRFSQKKNNNIPVPWAVRAPASLENFYLQFLKINPMLS